MSKKLPVLVALLPVAVLLGLLSLNVYIFKDDAVGGSNQIILLVAAALAAALALFNGSSWQTLEEGILKNLKLALPAILILLMVGALAGTWLVSGVIPTMVYYGLKILNPEIFLFASCVIAALVALFSGSSWTTSATVGIALMGVSQVLGIYPGLAAGAVLSGAYFGDKLSPLSDTTNLASAATDTDLFTHIRYLTYTTIPSITITLVLFLLIGFSSSRSDYEPTEVSQLLTSLDASFNITPWLLIVPMLVLLMIWRKMPPLPALFFGCLAAAIFAFIFQPTLVDKIGSQYGGGDYAKYIGIMKTAYGSTQLETGNETLDNLLSSNGMAGMLTTIWLIVTAMVFGGVMEASGFLRQITEAIINRVRSVAGLVTATAGTCIFTNLSASDQYLSVLLTGRMYAESYRQRQLASQNLSRTVEDTGTVTSVLVPWNTCGAFHASVLGVATLSYAPFAFFCLISPIMSILFAYFNIKIVRLDDEKNNSEEQVAQLKATAQ